MITTILTLAANWRIFQKMGRRGWEGIIPCYNLYVLFQELYGNGMRFLMMLIPVYGIIVMVRMYVELAHRFGKSTGYGIGLAFIFVVFGTILAFSGAVYQDGSKRVYGTDPISHALDSIAGENRQEAAPASAADELAKIKQLFDQGVITEEEYQKKRDELAGKL